MYTTILFVYCRRRALFQVGPVQMSYLLHKYGLECTLLFWGRVEKFITLTLVALAIYNILYVIITTFIHSLEKMNWSFKIKKKFSNFGVPSILILVVILPFPVWRGSRVSIVTSVLLYWLSCPRGCRNTVLL
jgi:hypothetical protein